MSTITNNDSILSFLTEVLKNLPNDWLKLTTHRLDLYDERLAKTQFLAQFEQLFQSNDAQLDALHNLPTAFDYIRLGHPLSCILEWVIAEMNTLKANNVISFSSKTMPVFAILRKNLLENKNTLICHTDELLDDSDLEILRDVYMYKFETKKVDHTDEVPPFKGSTIFISEKASLWKIAFTPNIDFSINTNILFGSVLAVNDEANEKYINEIQHVRRRETIAMTPDNCLQVLGLLIGNTPTKKIERADKLVMQSIQQITDTNTEAILGSSGLSIQYAILMGLIHDALEKHPGKDIKIVVPPNCYGGTNDQSRRVASCIKNVTVVDLPVDGEHNMVQSIDLVLDEIAMEDAIPYIIAEIPTNPRVEVPNLNDLKVALSKKRSTKKGQQAVDPVFILDQTFCPNVHFLGDHEILSSVRTISYVSGSKFPSGGLCTAGYCVANNQALDLMEKISLHIQLCDNGATNLQLDVLAKQLPSMNERIYDAYANTREFVNFIKETLPSAKINFVSEELAQQGFTPSVFSLDLPSKGNTHEEKEAYKRKLNHELISLMINEIPNESKFCVSYGQKQGCYWTIPATSTQGTTKEGDKDYIVRVSLSPNMDVALHKKVFLQFVEHL